MCASRKLRKPNDLSVAPKRDVKKIALIPILKPVVSIIVVYHTTFSKTSKKIDIEKKTRQQNPHFYSYSTYLKDNYFKKIVRSVQWHEQVSFFFIRQHNIVIFYQVSKSLKCAWKTETTKTNNACLYRRNLKFISQFFATRL